MRTAVILGLAAAVAGWAPAAAPAAVEPPPILGSWNVPDLGVHEVTLQGTRFRGRLVKAAPGAFCAATQEGRDTWRIDRLVSGGPAWRYEGGWEFFESPGCGSAGFGATSWEFSERGSVLVCVATPGDELDGTEDCQSLSRVGSAPAAVAPFAIGRPLVSCLADRAFFRSPAYVCKQLYYAGQPGTVRTEVFYRRTRSKIAKVATASLTFSQPGYGGLDIAVTKRGRKLLKKLAKTKRKIPLGVRSRFRPATGTAIVRGKRFTIKR